MPCAARALRAFFVWVMVIAMPLQAMAASAMGCCGFGHDRAMPVQTLASPAATAAPVVDCVHALASADAGAHGPAATGQPLARSAAAAAEGDGVSGLSPPSSCSACAACCAALALPARFALPPLASPAHLPQAAPAPPFASQSPDGLDRPPRAALA